MGLAAIVVEEHARAAGQLRHDDALRAVDDDGAVIGHGRHVAQVDFLFAHVLDRLLGAAGFLIEHHEAHFHAQRGRVGQTTQLAFLDVEHRLAQAVTHVLERGVPGIAGNGEHAVEGGVQPDFIAFGFRSIRLQESPVRIQLDRQQVRRAEDARTLTKVLTDALLFGERIGHFRYSSGAARRIQRGRNDPVRYQLKSRTQPTAAAYFSGNRRTARIGNNHYLIAALAPAASSFVLIASASAFGMPSLTVEGAPSTRSFASFKPRPVISRMTLMTPTLLAPNSVMVTVNSVCASAAGAAAPPPPPAAAAATGAAAVTLNFFSISAISSTTSMTVILEIESRISSLVTAIIVSK